MLAEINFNFVYKVSLKLGHATLRQGLIGSRHMASLPRIFLGFNLPTTHATAR